MTLLCWSVIFNYFLVCVIVKRDFRGLQVFKTVTLGDTPLDLSSLIKWSSCCEEFITNGKKMCIREDVKQRRILNERKSNLPYTSMFLLNQFIILRPPVDKNY